MLDNPKARAAIAGFLIATTTLLPAQQTQTPQSQPTTAPLPEAPVSQPVKPFDINVYSKPRPQLPNVLATYTPTPVPAPSFGNTPRVESLIQGNTLYLSLPDAISLALENNLDLAIARYDLPIANLDILRAKAGQSLLGTPTGLVQGTQGGGGLGIAGASTGAGAGGTSAGAGGVGAGTAGIVESTLGAGPAVPQFDPTLQGTLSLEQATQPQANRLSGATALTQHTTTGNFTYNQGFVTGTDLQVGFQNNRTSSNSTFNTFNPTLNSTFRATLTQHLLNGFGINNNNRFIRIANNNKRISDIAFENQVDTTVSQIEDIYWDLVNAYENVRVQERSVALAQQLLSDNQRQVQIGTLAPISVVQAQSQLATSNQSLIVGRTTLQLQQYLMLSAITRDVSNPRLRNVTVVPTDQMDLATYLDQNLDADQLTEVALKQNPTLKESMVDLESRDISRKAARNALLPTLDLFAFYGASSLAGSQNVLNTCGPGNTSLFCTPPGTITPSGFGSALNNLFNGTAPDKGVGVNLNIPIRNRAARSDQMRAEIEKSQAELRLQQLKNQIITSVKNAVYAVQQDRAQVDAAKAAREYASQNLDAEKKKYQLGASTTYNVMQLQTALTQAEQSLLSAVTTYEKARVALDLITNQTLDRYGIQLTDAISGDVKKQPTVPGVAPRQDQPQSGVNAPPSNAPNLQDQQQLAPGQPSQQQPQTPPPATPQGTANPR